MGPHRHWEVSVIRDSFALVPSFSARSLTCVWFHRILRRRQGRSTGTPAHSGSGSAQVRASTRKYDVHEDVITGYRCNRTKSQAVFIALDQTVEGVTETLKEAFGVDASRGFAQKRELAQLIAAWEESKIQSETKNRVGAVAGAHAEPISHLPADWESIMKGFKQKHRANIP